MSIAFGVSPLHRWEPASAPRVIIVDVDRESLQKHATILGEAGYAVTVASTFAEARADLRRHPPDALVADIRLEGYNGLQLVITASQLKPTIATIVTHTVADPVLETEATRLGATYLRKPIDRATLSNAVAATLGRARPLHLPLSFRQSPRKRPAALHVRVGDDVGRVLDVGYGGLSFEASPGRGETPCGLPPVVDVDVPGVTPSLRVAVVWSHATERGCLVGARLDEEDQPATRAWREFVDHVA